MPKYIIHVGPPKTGSKNLQSQLFHNREFLEENGVHYPGDWWSKPDDMYHFALFDILRQRKDGLESVFSKINNSAFNTVIFSSEALDGLEISEMERLRDAAGNNPVEIVYYVRRWSERITSDWRERVRMGHYVTFPECYARLLYDPYETGEINYSKVWDRFAKVFGRQSLKIVSFSNLTDAGVEPFDHFCRVFLGLTDPPQTAREFIRRNKGANAIDTEIMRALNFLYHMNTSCTDITMRVKFNRLKDGRDPRVLKEYRKLKELLESDLQQIEVNESAALLERTWQAISAYSDCLGSPEYGKTMFERRVLKLQLIGQNYLLRAGAADTLRGLYDYLVITPVTHPIFETAG